MAGTSDRMGGRGSDRKASQQAAAVPVRPAGKSMAEVAPLAKPADAIPWYRRCPVCWNGSGGVGNAYTTSGSTRYYKCCQSIHPDKGPCGHTWTATVRTEIVKVESRTVQLDAR